MNAVFKLFFVTVFLCKEYCVHGQLPYEYQLPDNEEIKNLNVTVQYQKLQVECKNYNALKDFKFRTNDGKYADYNLQNNRITFFNCFNNDTDNGNSKSNLIELLQKNNSNRYDENDEWAWSSTEVRLIPYAIVNSDVLFRNYPFYNFHDVKIIDVGFKNTRFLSAFCCRSCTFANTNEIDFNNFNVSHKMKILDISNTKLINLNSDNMRKINNLTHFKVNTFSLDDYNTFNVSGLFEQQTSLSELKLTHSDGEIVFHDDVFRGLKNVEVLTLEHLQLQSIPPNLFNDMEKVVIIKLNSNNIKTLATSFELNLRLKEVQLKANPIFSEPHDQIDQLVIGGSKLRFYFENFTIHTRNTVKKLINNERIDVIDFESLETDFIIQDFLNMDTDRIGIALFITFKRYPSGYLDWDYLNANGIAHQDTFNVRMELRDSFNVQISLPFSGQDCHNCWMMKKFFHAFLSTFDAPGFYFEHSRVLLKFEKGCTNQLAYFDEEYTENCVPSCKCIHNPLSDQIIIDCRNRNLTEFPIIPYPVQYNNDTIYTIDLLFKNNLLRQVSFEEQDKRVLEKLATLDFSNNRIKSITMMGTDVNNVKSLNLCYNPILDDIKPRILTLIMSGVNHQFSSYLCKEMRPAHRTRLDPNDYVLKTKSKTFIDQFLNKIKCL